MIGNGPDSDRRIDPMLRRLLHLDDTVIIDRIRQDRERQTVERDRINGAFEPVPAKPTEQERVVLAAARGRALASVRPDLFAGPIITDGLEPSVIKIRAIVRFAGNRADLESLGLSVGAQAQDIFTVVGTKAQLADLAAQPAMRSLRLPRPVAAMVEQAGAQAEIHAVHQPRPTVAAAYRGKGVIVGIVDSSLDVTHHAFQVPNGWKSRVLHYWVQTPDHKTAPGQTPEARDPQRFVGLSRGRLYSRSGIETALKHSGGPYGNAGGQISAKPKPHEHGTVVAGVAAGNGHGSDWTKPSVHVGAAPDADIIHVRTGNDAAFEGQTSWDTAFEDSLIEGLDFIFRAADEAGKPAVANLSQVGQVGPHDGTSLLDQACDNMLNSYGGRCIVCAAGNGNDDAGVRHGMVAAGAEESFTLTVHPVTGSNGTILDIWSAGPELEFRFRHEAEDKGWFPAGAGYDSDTQGMVNYHHVWVERDAEAGSGTALHNIRFIIVPHDPAKHQCHVDAPWTIRLRNPGSATGATYTAWVGMSAGSGTLSGAEKDRYSLTDAGCGKAVLTVGACEKRIPPAPDKGEAITAYSAAGPTLDGRVKPDIVTVGGTAAIPLAVPASDMASGYTTDWGTSLAAPLAAGAVALLLEQRRGLRTDTIKALLIQSANRAGLNLDPQAAGYAPADRNRYGHGRLRLLPPIDRAEPLADVDVWIRTADDDFGLEPCLGDCFWTSPDIVVRRPGTSQTVHTLEWDQPYSVVVTCRNLGHDGAVGTTLSLKYALPSTAPIEWVPTRRQNGDPNVSSAFTIPALNRFVITFEWVPRRSDLNAPEGTTHFCLLAELDHPRDKLEYAQPTLSTAAAFARNVRGNNNIALRNVHIV